MTKQIHLKTVIPVELNGERLDKALSSIFSEHSRARLQSWIKQGAVLVNGKALKPRERIKTGDSIKIKGELDQQLNFEAQDIELDIIYEDDDLIVINKPIGLVVHPGAGNHDNTLLNALLHHDPELANVPRAGIVHRLDKDTSGLLVIAKNIIAHKRLVIQLQKRKIHREYQTIVNGQMIAGGSISKPIGRHPTKRTQMAIVGNGKPATTHYRIIGKFKYHTHLRVFLESGRTHQIRVHMTYLKHPIIGDKTYNKVRFPANSSDELKQALINFSHQALHASHLELTHPTTKEQIAWDAPLPTDFQQLLETLRAEESNG